MPPKANLQSLKHENDELRNDMKKMMKELQSTQERITKYEKRMESGQNGAERESSQETLKTLEFVSDEYDDMKLFCSVTRKQLSSLNSRVTALEEIAEKVSKAIEDNLKYSYQYNMKIVGIPQVRLKESALETGALCLSLFRALGVEVSPMEIDIAHRVSTRNLRSGGIKPIICKFVSRQTKEKIMENRGIIHTISAADIGLPEGYSLGRDAAFYDHLTPSTQQLYGEAKKCQERYKFAYCWAKNGVIFLRKAEGSRPLRISSQNDLDSLAYHLPAMAEAPVIQVEDEVTAEASGGDRDE